MNLLQQLLWAEFCNCIWRGNWRVFWKTGCPWGSPRTPTIVIYWWCHVKYRFINPLLRCRTTEQPRCSGGRFSEDLRTQKSALGTKSDGPSSMSFNPESPKFDKSICKRLNITFRHGVRCRSSSELTAKSKYPSETESHGTLRSPRCIWRCRRQHRDCVRKAPSLCSAVLNLAHKCLIGPHDENQHPLSWAILCYTLGSSESAKIWFLAPKFLSLGLFFQEKRLS